jgi:hypothetical protein
VTTSPEQSAQSAMQLMNEHMHLVNKLTVLMTPPEEDDTETRIVRIGMLDEVKARYAEVSNLLEAAGYPFTDVAAQATLEPVQ